MGAYITLLATLFSQLRARQDADDAEAGRHEEAKKQHLLQMRRELAQQLDPGTPMFGAENADFAHQEALARRGFNAQKDQNTRQMYASILPAAVSAFGNAWSGGADPAANADTATNNMLSNWRSQEQLPWNNTDASQLRWG